MIKYQKSRCHGSGLIAQQDIEGNNYIWDTHIAHPQLTGLWLNIIPNCLYNHSSAAPNCKILTKENTKSLHSLKEIKAGHEILVDYSCDKDLEQPLSQWKDKQLN
tara:strand:- start:2582 stop:2896 length:315 start_codon:yes stop_codon:yes gene_type:complete